MPMDDAERVLFQEFQIVGANFLSHPRLREVAEAFGDNAEENFSEANKDPKKFLQSRGIDLPARFGVNVTRNTPIQIDVCAGRPPTMYCLTVTLPEITISQVQPPPG